MGSLTWAAKPSMSESPAPQSSDGTPNRLLPAFNSYQWLRIVFASGSIRRFFLFIACIPLDDAEFAPVAGIGVKKDTFFSDSTTQ